MPKILCMISLIAFSAINSVNSHYLDGNMTTTVINEDSIANGPMIQDITTTTEKTSTTTTEKTSTTTARTTTSTTPVVQTVTETETTANKPVTSTTVTARPVTNSTTVTPPQGGIPFPLCCIKIQEGPLIFNPFYGCFTIPKTCYYCCHVGCYGNIAIERCTVISPYYCNLCN